VLVCPTPHWCGPCHCVWVCLACRFYDYNKLDQNALIGYHPECKNMLVASGFSGHGLMQTPAVGLHSCFVVGMV